MYEIAGSLILVVEHSDAFRAKLCQFLQEKDYAVCEASSGKEAIEVFDRTSPKMVLMGEVIPDANDGISALDACRRIREIDRDEYSPVLVITSTDDDALIAAAFEAGAADYVVKPIRWTLLEHRIKFKLKASKSAYALQASEERFRQLFEDSPLPYQALNEQGCIVDVNAAWLEMMGMETEQVLGKSFGDLMGAGEWRKFMYMFPSFIKNGVLSNLRLTINHADGSPIVIELNGRVAYDIHGDFKQTHCVLQNITERIAMENELRRMATSDPLTGLANRRAFFAAADRALLQCARYHHPYTVMMLDIDHFKSINDTFGHDVGDQVLKLASQHMKSRIRNVDIMGRLGGEEFAITLPETDLSTALDIAERIRLSVASLSLETDQGRVSFTISIGLTKLADACSSNEQLIKQADELLYRAKQNGRNRVEAELT